MNLKLLRAFVLPDQFAVLMASVTRAAIPAAPGEFHAFFLRHPEYAGAVNHYGDHLVSSLNKIGMSATFGKFAKRSLFVRNNNV